MSHSNRKDLSVKKFFSRTAILSILLLLVSGTNAYSAPKPKNKAKDPVIMTVVHAIPAGSGADKVDIYANGTLVFNDAQPGMSKTFSIESGLQKVAIYADGVVPSSETASVLSYRPIYLSHGMDVSFVAHLDSSSKPTLSLFKNMNTEPGKKRSWLTVRHVAAAPAVDVKSNSLTLFRSVTNGLERKVSLRYGTYPVNVLLAGTTTTALPATSVEIKDEKNLIVYVWGSAAKANLQYLTQVVNAK